MASDSSATLIQVDAGAIRRLDLSPLSTLQSQLLLPLLADLPCYQLQYEWPRAEEDPRELSECAEPRLWALRADGQLPWLPMVLDRNGGSLIQHVAMVVPHEFNRRDGLRFEPQALELWITHRLMLLDSFSLRLGQPMRGNLTQMAAALGYELDSGFWDLLNPRSNT